LAVVGLLLGLLATVATTRVAAQADEVKLTIHVLACPTDAEGDIFEACHDKRVKGAEFQVEGTDDPVASDKDGVVSATVASGEVDLEETDFDAIATAGKAIVYCSPQPGGKPLSEYKTTDGKVTIEIADDVDEVHCDWYNRTGEQEPEPGTAERLWIHVLDCPVDAEGDIFEACHDNRLEGVNFEIDGTVYTSDADGVVNVDNPPAGEVSIHELDFDAIATAGKAFVYCSVQPGGSPVLVSRNDTDGKVSVDLPEGAEVHCDWYNRTSATGPTPTSEATETPEPTETAEPTETPDNGGGGNATSTAEATGTTTLPDTGAGPTDGSSSGGNFAVGLGLIVLAIGGLAYGLRRRSGSIGSGA
jgi:hypothetical protein